MSGKKEFKSMIDMASARLGRLQRDCKEEKIPVFITFDGFDAAGKGQQINRLIQALDPRGFDVYTGDKTGEEEAMHPFLWRFFTKIPAAGRITIFDTSWYRIVQTDRFEGQTRKGELTAAFEDILAFERQLTDDGMVLIKLFLAISEKEQKERFEKLESSKETAWRVTKADWKRNEHYKEYWKISQEMMVRTDTKYAPWHIIDANKKNAAALQIMNIVADAMETALERKRDNAKVLHEEETSAEQGLPDVLFQNAHQQETVQEVLNKADLTKTLNADKYHKRLDKLQKKLELLHSELYRQRIPVILGFEGWDAAGKGGAIRRLTSHLDPRGYEVCPTASPNDVEKSHHYLWRFWNRMPKDGHIAVFDRTWYGRVMVERIEGFCTEAEWKRAYEEINQMERHLSNHGAVILKFWLHIDKDEQERRFNDRMTNPEKRWKITDEDWRNREKWDQYETAVNEMLVRTSTECAPWIVVEGNSKYYARIKVLETVVKALEKKIKEVEKTKKNHE